MPRKRLPPRLYQRPDTGEWIIRDGPSSWRTGCGNGQRREAEEALARYILGREPERRSGPSHPHELTVGEVLAAYVDAKAEVVKGVETLASNVVSLTSFWGDLTCDAVKGSTCRAYEKHRAKPRLDAFGHIRTAGSATVRRELGVLQAALNYAHGEGLLIHPIKVVLSEAGQVRERWLTVAEAAALIRAASPHCRRFILISLYTGRRMKAVLDLTWSRVDLDAGIIRFRVEGQRETKKRRGSVPISRRLLSLWKKNTRPGETHVVMQGGRPLKSIRTAMDRACEQAGLDLSASRHVLKHTAITWAMRDGTSVEGAAEYFDTSAKTIRSTYWHHSPHHQAEGRAAMEREA